MELPDKRSWHDWLEKNHDCDLIVWLIIHKRSTGERRLTYAEALEEAICFGWIDSRLKRIDDRKHMVRFSKRKRNSSWSLKNLMAAKALIEKGMMTEAGTAVLPKDLDTEMELAKQRAEEELSVPEDLMTALQSAGLMEVFASMSPSHRRVYYHWITQAKRPETRSKRVRESLVHIEKKELPIDMTKWNLGK